MNEAAASVTLDMPRSRAWEILRDLGIAHNYVPGVHTTEMLTKQTSGVGASRRVHRRGGRSLDETVIEWQDGRGFVLRLHEGEGLPPAPFSEATFGYQLEDEGHARSRMVITLSYQPRWGALGSVLDKLLLHKAILKTQHSLAGRIKKYYESL